MKLYFKLPYRLKEFVDNELNEAKTSFRKADLQTTWRHQERAHFHRQAYPIEHSKAYWQILLFGLMIKNTKEILGQMPRLLVGEVISFVGEIPPGNSGGSYVPPLKPMEIPEDLSVILEYYKK